MEETLASRLNTMETLIIALAQQSKDRWDIRELKIETAKVIIGMPYYWGSWSGVIEPSSDPTYIIAKLVNQQTGETNHWKLDAAHAAQHVETIKEFKDWNSYWNQQLIDAAHNHSAMIRKFGWTQKQIEEEMEDFCEKFGITFQDSFIFEGAVA